jgi:hypothetical protein
VQVKYEMVRRVAGRISSHRHLDADDRPEVSKSAGHQGVRLPHYR